MDQKDFVGKDPRNGWGTYSVFGKVFSVNWEWVALIELAWVLMLLFLPGGVAWS